MIKTQTNFSTTTHSGKKFVQQSPERIYLVYFIYKQISQNYIFKINIKNKKSIS